MTYLFYFLFSVQSFGCGSDVVSTERHTLQIQTVNKGRECIVSAYPRGKTPVRRKFILNDQGMFMVMVENTTGSSKLNTASRTYHIVPVAGDPKITDRNGNPGFQDASGMRWQSKRSEWATDSCEIKAGEAPTLLNEGAYEIIKCNDRFVIDSGWKRGGTARDDRQGKSTLTAGNGSSCRILNSEIFAYKAEEPKLKIQTSAQIQEFLKSKPACAGLLKEASSNHKTNSGSE